MALVGFPKRGKDQRTKEDRTRHGRIAQRTVMNESDKTTGVKIERERERERERQVQKTQRRITRWFDDGRLVDGDRPEDHRKRTGRICRRNRVEIRELMRSVPWNASSVSTLWSHGYVSQLLERSLWKFKMKTKKKSAEALDRPVGHSTANQRHENGTVLVPTHATDNWAFQWPISSTFRCLTF